MTTQPAADYLPSEAEAFMSSAQIAYFRQRLEQMRAELRHELEAIPHADADDGTREGDQTDHASADTEREFGLVNHRRVEALLARAEQALVRLDNGTFGYCADTGEPIGLKRLIAQPATDLSLAAQEARERRAG